MTLDDWRVILEKDKSAFEGFIIWLQDEQDNLSLVEAVKWSIETGKKPLSCRLSVRRGRISTWGIHEPFFKLTYCWQSGVKPLGISYFLEVTIFDKLQGFIVEQGDDRIQWRDYDSWWNAMMALWRAKSYG